MLDESCVGLSSKNKDTALQQSEETISLVETENRALEATLIHTIGERSFVWQTDGVQRTDFLQIVTTNR